MQVVYTQGFLHNYSWAQKVPNSRMDTLGGVRSPCSWIYKRMCRSFTWFVFRDEGAGACHLFDKGKDGEVDVGILV